MEILHSRYKELTDAELTLNMIENFIKNARFDISDESVLDHITWLIQVNNEKGDKRNERFNSL